MIEIIFASIPMTTGITNWHEAYADPPIARYIVAPVVLQKVAAAYEEYGLATASTPQSHYNLIHLLSFGWLISHLC